MVDDDLAARMRALLGDTPDLTERRMFGGMAFMVNGNMACGLSKAGAVMIRATPDAVDQMLAEGATQMHMGPRPMTGFLEAPGDARDDDDLLAAWIARGVACAESLPPK